MAVKDVFRPEATNPSDPKNPRDKNEGKVGEWENKAKEAKAEREYMEEQERIKRMGQPLPPQEPAFQVQGGVRLDIDPQRDANLARQELREQQERDGDKIEKLTSDLNKTKDELRESHITAVMKEMSNQFAGALKEMNDRIGSVRSGSDPTILASQFEVLTQIAEKMGFQKSTPQIGDPMIQLEITKLQMENARADREFKAKLEQDKREWDLEKIKLEDDRSFKRAQLAQEEKRNELFVKAPQMVGGAIAQGIMSARGGGIGAKESPPPPKSSKKQPRHIEAGQGESGEIECPGCNQPVAIGPTARVAVCANCGERVPVKRISGEPSSQEEEE